MSIFPSRGEPKAFSRSMVAVLVDKYWQRIQILIYSMFESQMVQLRRLNFCRCALTLGKVRIAG